MTDVPSDQSGSEEQEDGWEPSGIRRSTFSPPPDGAPLPTFDDDALAEAMAAEVRPYTAPITLPSQPTAPPAPPVQTPASPAPPPEPTPSAYSADPLPVPEAPVVAAPAFFPSAPAASAEPVSAPEPALAPEPDLGAEPDPGADADIDEAGLPTSDQDLLDSLNGTSTLDAIEKLEQELRRRSQPPQEPDAPASPEAAPSVESAALAAPAAAEPLAWNAAPEPALDHPAPGHLFPSPYSPFGPAPAPAAEPAVAPDPQPAVAPEPQPEAPPEPQPEPIVEPAAAEPAAAEPTATEPTAAEPAATEPSPEVLAWLSAPPPAYSPPPLVEPPATGIPVAPPPSGEPGTSFELPPPTDLPNLAERAELPPPPGYLSDGTATGAIAELPPLPPAWDPPAPVSTPPLSPDWDSLVSEPVPEATESSALDRDDDVVDDVDRVFGTGSIPVSAAGFVDAPAPPSAPIPTSRLSEGEPALVDEKPQQHPAFEIEVAGAEPTALDLRAGRAARLFWLWFAANSSIISLALGAVLFGLGMSLRQAIVATLAGVAISFLPLGLGTLAGKWSGQPTMVVSRAMFGHVGNVIPALLAIVVRVFWGGVLLWLLADSVAKVLVGAGLDAGLGETVWSLVGLVLGFVIATLVAVFGYGLLARLQLLISVVSGILIVGAAVLTYRNLDFSAALSQADGPWILVVTGAVLVFSFVGLAWVHSSSDLARYQRTSSYGGPSMLWATFGATLPPFLLIAWGAMLAASSPKLASGLATAPLATIAGLLPSWYPAPLLAAAALGLLSGAVLTIYSGGFAIQSLAQRLPRFGAVLIAAVLVAIAAVVLVLLVSDTRTIVRDLATTLAVPVAAWAGIFAAEMMIRTRRFHTPSLLARGGIYPSVRWVNLIGLVVIAAVGYGFTRSGAHLLGWQGYLFAPLGVRASDPLASSDGGVLIALALGIILPLVTAIPVIRRQERTEAGTVTSPT